MAAGPGSVMRLADLPETTRALLEDALPPGQRLMWLSVRHPELGDIPAQLLRRGGRAEVETVLGQMIEERAGAQGGAA